MAAAIISGDEESVASDFVDYLNASCSPFHCVEEVKRRLLQQGFEQLDERLSWKSKIVNGGRYFVTRNGSSLIAFAVGSYDFRQVRSEIKFCIITTNGFLAGYVGVLRPNFFSIFVRAHRLCCGFI